jgi:L-ascorbate metabolism protein UlaG (beta-lactamase superfamily)
MADHMSTRTEAAGTESDDPASATSLEVAWLGHATVDIRLGTDRFLTDPVLRDRFAHLRRHRGTSEVEAPAEVSAVLISHLHHDHLDLPSLRQLPDGLPCIVPRGAARLLRGTGLDVTEVSVDDDIRIGDTTITVVPAEHRSNRFASRRQAHAIGYVLQRASRTVYFPGDTDLHPAMSDLPAPDVALLPIWGWGATIGVGHLDPHRAAQAAALLRARSILPIHWGTFAPAGLRRGEPRWFDRPAQELAGAIAAESPTTRLDVVLPGSALHPF